MRVVPWNRSLAAAFVIVLLAAELSAQSMSTARRHPSRSERIPLPNCAVIEGTAAVTFTGNDGRLLTPTSGPLHGVNYTMGLVALETPGVLLAAAGTSLIRSTDHGCSWSVIGELRGSEGFPPFLTAARGNRAYAWADQRSDLFSIDGMSVRVLKSPVTAMIGLGVDPGTSDHVRIAGGDGSVWDSSDGGASWTARPGKAPPASIFYRARFEEADLDHIVLGTASTGSFLSRDGGLTWTASRGLGAKGANIFELTISVADPRIVWAAGIDFAELDGGAPSGGRHIYLSEDGGASFRPVVDASPTVTIRNGPVMAAHPANPNLMYFAFGSYFQKYGTDLYRFDVSNGQLTTEHNSYDGIDAIAFQRGNPSVMYLGLESVEFTEPIASGWVGRR
ncbi:MAG TPA: sialidase family protein [Thermoanaerobaculia bacterium]|nr:sialidase family protein [Thermoanaerobaculia bacterium]